MSLNTKDMTTIYDYMYGKNFYAYDKVTNKMNRIAINSVYGLATTLDVDSIHPPIKYGEFVNISIKKVIFNDPATIVIWDDGTKTVVKCQEGDVFDKEKGLAMCICKHVFGNKSNFNNIIKKYTEDI